MNRRRLGLAALLLIVLSAVALIVGGGKHAKKAAGGGAEGSATVVSPGEPTSRTAITPPADPLTAPRGRIEGKISDPGGAPIAGATVCATGSSKLMSTQEVREPTCVKSAVDGAYVIADLFAVTYGVSAAAPHFIPANYQREVDGSWPDGDVDLEHHSIATGIDLTLKPGGVEARGRVKDLSGGVVVGATVLVHGGSRWQWNAGVVTKSDDHGEFSAWVDSGHVTVTANAEGYGQGEKEGTAPGQTIEVLLTPEAVLVGRVIEAGAGTPIEGALVELPDQWQSYSGGTSARTDADGRFRIDRLQPGRYKPTATAFGRYGQAKESVLLGLGQTSSEVVIEVIAVRVLEGHVVIVATDGKRRSCARAWVALDDHAHGLSQHAASDDGGKVLFRALRPGTYEARVRCDAAIAEDKYPTIAVTDHDVTDVTWEVKDGSAIHGIVVDEDGAPIDEAWVSAQSTGGDPRAQHAWSGNKTKNDGLFVVRGVRPGKYKLSASAKDRPNRWDQPTEVTVPAGSDLNDVKLVIPNGGSIEGDVSDEDGAPVGGVDVRLEGGRNAWGAETTSRDDGTFLMKGIDAGEYRVVASRGWENTMRAPGQSDDDIKGTKTIVKAGQTSHAHVTIERQTGVIHGVVVDADGRPVTDAFVDAQRESDSAAAASDRAQRELQWSWDRAPSLTDTEGKFTIEKLSKGTYAVRAFRRGGGDATAQHVALGTTVTLRIPVTATIEGKVETAGGAAPDDFTINVTDRKKGFQREEAFFRTGGAFAMRDLPAGDFDLSATGPDGDVMIELSVAAGEKKTGVVLRMVARASVHGQAVSFDDGAPIPGLRAVIYQTRGGGSSGWEGTQERKNVTDATGHFDIERAPVSKAYVMLSPVDFQDSDWGWGWAVRTIVSGENDLPPIRVVKRRVKPPALEGDLGFDIKEMPPDTEPDAMTFNVAVVRPDGPAAAAGLRVGDVITSVDGNDVTGVNAYLFEPLTTVLEGTKVTLGVARGDKIEITAGKHI